MVAEPGLGSASAAGASRAVVGRGSLYTIGTAAPILANVLVTPAVTRILGGTEYGVVATALVVIQVGMMLLSLGMPSVITRHGILESSGVEGAKSLVIRAFAITVTLGALVLAASPWWAPGALGIGWRPAIGLAVAAAVAFALVESCQSFLRVLDRPLPFVALSSLATLGGPLTGLVLLQAVERQAGVYVLGQLVGYATAGVVGVALVLRGRRPRAAPGDLGRALRIGLPVIPHLVALFLAGGALTVVANHAFGVQAGGRLSLAVLLGSAAGVVVSALNNSWAPVVYRTPEADRGPVVERTARDLALLTALAAGGVSALSPWLLRLLAPPDFDTDALVAAVAITAVGSVVSVAYLANVHLVFASGRSTGLALVTPPSVVVGIGVAQLAAVTDHLVWVAAGFPATYLALAFGTAVLRRRVSRTTWREGRLVAPVGAGIGLCALGGGLPAGAGATSLRLAVAGLLAVLAALMVVRILRR